jgi:hypothetical protein
MRDLSAITAKRSRLIASCTSSIGLSGPTFGAIILWDINDHLSVGY